MHRSHISVPFRGGGLPGVNLSKVGNVGWKPYNTLRLEHAAKQDTATMILHKKEIYLFNRNQEKSTGQDPSKAVRNSRDRQEQIKIAENFVNILDDKEDLCQEAEQAENPNALIPRGNAKHKPPKKAKTNDVQEESKKASKGRKKTAPKEKTSSKEQKEVNIDDARFAENFTVATEVIAQSGENSGTSEEAETSQQLSTGDVTICPKKPNICDQPSW